MTLPRPLRLVYLRVRHSVRMRLIRIERAKARKFLSMPVDKAPRFDDRSTIDVFRRMNR